MKQTPGQPLRHDVRVETFYAEPVTGTTVRHRSAPRQRTYALSEGLAGSTAQGGTGWRVRGPYIAHVRVLAPVDAAGLDGVGPTGVAEKPW